MDTYVPTIENVADSCPIAWTPEGERFALWENPCAWEWVSFSDLVAALQLAFDPTDPRWPESGIVVST